MKDVLPTSGDGCLQRTASADKDAGAVVYLMEELGDARLRCDQLVRYLSEGAKLIEKSSHKDHFFEVAGHLIQAVPVTAFKLQKALQAVALAASRIDYEELKRELRPEKVQELERVLEDVRIRQVQRRSGPLQDMTPRRTAEYMRTLAQMSREAGGVMPYSAVASLILALEDRTKEASESAGEVLDKLAESLERAQRDDQAPSRTVLAAILRRMLGDANVEGYEIVKEAESVMGAVNWKSDKAGMTMGEGDKKGLGIDPDYTQTLNEKNLIAFLKKNKTISVHQIGYAFSGERKDHEKLVKALVSKGVLEQDGQKYKLKKGSTMEGFTPDPEWVAGSAEAGKRNWKAIHGGDEEKRTRFEEGKPADPTKNMSPDEKAEWEANTEKHKDKFKKKDAYAFGGDEEKRTRFEEGKPADPTKNMSPEEAKEWKANTEKHKDKFKKEALRRYPNAFYVVNTKTGKVVDGPFSVSEGDSVVKARSTRTDQLIEGRWLTEHAFKVAGDEEKRTRFEEGKPADPTKNMSPEEAKEWKANTEKHKDKFKKEAVSSMGEGKWYMQRFKNGDEIYFVAQAQQKNKGWKGLQVDVYGGRPSKAKKSSVHPTSFQLWKEVSESKVPKGAMSKAKARMASDPWKSDKAGGRGADDVLGLVKYQKKLQQANADGHKNSGWEWLTQALEALNGLAAYGQKSRFLSQRVNAVEDEAKEVREGLRNLRRRLGDLQTVLDRDIIGIAEDISDEAKTESEWADYMRTASNTREATSPDQWSKATKILDEGFNRGDLLWLKKEWDDVEKALEDGRKRAAVMQRSGVGTTENGTFVKYMVKPLRSVAEAATRMADEWDKTFR